MRRSIVLLFLVIAVNSSLAAIGLTFEQLQSRYGTVVEIDRYRPDLYPSRYVFRADSAELRVTILDGKAVHTMVAFKKAPDTRDGSELVRRYSGVEDWSQQPLTDSRFAKHFPLFSTTDRRNTFFAWTDESVFALVQRDVGDGELVIWISTKDYLNQLDDYRKQQPKGT